MSAARFLVGDVQEQIATLPDDSVDLVLTSPPFLALRSYLPAGHPDKAKEGGSQATPGEYIDWLLDVTEALDRVLAPHGTLCVELGDTYSAGGGALKVAQDRPQDSGYDADDRVQYEGQRAGIRNMDDKHQGGGPGWPPLDKSLTLIPELYRLSLAYGHNPLTGRATEPWRVRNVVRWVRPNPPVGALGDKFRPATSELVIACKARDRYFDLDAVREAYSPKTNARVAKGAEQIDRTGKSADRGGNWSTLPERDNDGAGAPPLDWWEIPTHSYKGAHHATWSPDLCTRPIKAMSPPGGTVLDPFAGSGTTLAVATGLGRDAIGIDLDPRNADLARQRVGMFLTVEEGEAA